MGKDLEGAAGSRPGPPLLLPTFAAAFRCGHSTLSAGQ